MTQHDDARARLLLCRQSCGMSHAQDCHGMTPGSQCVCDFGESHLLPTHTRWKQFGEKGESHPGAGERGSRLIEHSCSSKSIFTGEAISSGRHHTKLHTKLRSTIYMDDHIKRAFGPDLAVSVVAPG
jgi:hypothetical protein